VIILIIRSTLFNAKKFRLFSTRVTQNSRNELDVRLASSGASFISERPLEDGECCSTEVVASHLIGGAAHTCSLYSILRLSNTLGYFRAESECMFYWFPLPRQMLLSATGIVS